MADIKAIKLFSQFNAYMVIRYQVFMTNHILSFDLIGNQFGVTVGVEILYLHLSGGLETNEQSIALSYIIGTRFR